MRDRVAEGTSPQAALEVRSLSRCNIGAILQAVEQGLIGCDPAILGGKPVIRGTRISVAFVLQSLASGMSVDDILRGYPHLTREGVLAAVAFAARTFDGESVLPVPK